MQSSNFDFANIFVSLLSNNLKDIPFHKYEKNFTFVVNGKRYETNRVVADILSPIIRNYHYQDESIDEFEINTNIPNQTNFEKTGNEPDYFLDFLNLGNLDSTEIDLAHKEYYLQYLRQLGCRFDFININPTFSDELTTENSVERLKTILLLFPEYPQDEKSIYFQIIQFIAINFDEISKEELKTLDMRTIEDILRNDHICLQNEDGLLEFVLELYKKDRSNSPLFEYIQFNYASDEIRKEFLQTFSIDDIDSCLLRSIFRCFCTENENENENEKERNKRYFTKNIRCLMLGINNVGKTKILYKMKLGEECKTIPTIGFNCETVNHCEFECSIWDVGGQERIRVLWKHYYNNNDALIYVVDSSDNNRMNEASDELRKLLNVDELKGLPLLVFANKCDLPNAMGADDIANRLRLNDVTDRAWFVQPSSALTGHGLNEGLDFICKQVKIKHKKNKSIV